MDQIKRPDDQPAYPATKRVSFGPTMAKCYSPSEKPTKTLTEAEIQEQIDYFLKRDSELDSSLNEEMFIDLHKKNFRRLQEIMKENLRIIVEMPPEEEISKFESEIAGMEEELQRRKEALKEEQSHFSYSSIEISAEIDHFHDDLERARKETEQIIQEESEENTQLRETYEVFNECLQLKTEYEPNSLVCTNQIGHKFKFTNKEDSYKYTPLSTPSGFDNMVSKPIDNINLNELKMLFVRLYKKK